MRTQDPCGMRRKYGIGGMKADEISFKQWGDYSWVNLA